VRDLARPLDHVRVRGAAVVLVDVVLSDHPGFERDIGVERWGRASGRLAGGGGGDGGDERQRRPGRQAAGAMSCGAARHRAMLAGRSYGGN
jgi:hypothetical protein